MWRYFAGGVAALLIVAAGWALFMGRAGSSRSPIAPEPLAAASSGQAAPAALPDTVPEASDQTREQKRFDRYDKDRDGSVTREEYLTARRKAFAKLDTDHNGQLSFDEWAIKAETKFAAADHDKSGAMNATEFATTAVKRKPAHQLRCPPPEKQPASGDDEG